MPRAAGSSTLCLLLVASQAWLLYATVASLAAAWVLFTLLGPGGADWVLLAPPLLHGVAVAWRASMLGLGLRGGLVAVWSTAPLVFLNVGGDMDPAVVTLFSLSASSAAYLAASRLARGRPGRAPRACDPCLLATGPVWLPYVVLPTFSVIGELLLPPSPGPAALNAYAAAAGAALGASLAMLVKAAGGCGCLLCGLEAYGASLAWAAVAARLVRGAEPWPLWVVFALSGFLGFSAVLAAVCREKLRDDTLEEEP